jgi:hypothetical protein
MTTEENEWKVDEEEEEQEELERGTIDEEI